MSDASYSTCLELCRMSCSNQAQHNANMIDRSRRVALRGGMHTSLSCSRRDALKAAYQLCCGISLSQLSAPRAVHESTCAVYGPRAFIAKDPFAPPSRAVTHRGRFCFALHGTVGSACPQEPAPTLAEATATVHAATYHFPSSNPMRHARLRYGMYE